MKRRFMRMKRRLSSNRLRRIHQIKRIKAQIKSRQRIGFIFLS